MLGLVNALEPGFRPGVRWGWCHGGVLQTVGRSETLPSTPALPGRGLRARRLPISRSERRASPSHHPPPGPRGAGAHGYPGTPDRRPLGAWPNCRPCAECSPPKFIGGLSQTAMGVTLALVPRPRYGVSASLWCRAFRFWAVIPPRRRDSRRPVLAQTAATLQVSTPGFWVVLQENGLEFDALPGVLGGYFGSSLRFASMATV